MLPAPRAGDAFEGADDVAGDPASVEVAGLGRDLFAGDGDGVEGGGVEAEVVFQVAVGGGGGGVAPGDFFSPAPVDLDAVVDGLAFPLAEAVALRRADVLHLEVGGGQIVGGRVAGFEDAVGAGGIGEGDAVENHDNALGHAFDAGRAGIVPNGFLAGAGLDGGGAIKHGRGLQTGVVV